MSGSLMRHTGLCTKLVLAACRSACLSYASRRCFSTRARVGRFLKQTSRNATKKEIITQSKQAAKAFLALAVSDLRQNPLVFEGHTLRQQGDIDGAHECFSKLAAENPGSWYAHYLAAQTLEVAADSFPAPYKHLGEREKRALSFYEQSLKLRPQYNPAQLGLADLFIKMSQPQRAAECLEKFLADMDVAAKRRPAKQKQSLTDALPDMSATQNIEFNIADAHYRLGLLRILTKHYKAAAAHLERAAEITPQLFFDWRYLLNLGEAYAQLGKLDTALEHLRSASQLNPKHARTYHSLAVVHFKLGQHDEGITSLKKGLSRDPIDPLLMEALGTALKSKEGAKAKELSEYYLKSARDISRELNRELALDENENETEKAGKERTAAANTNADNAADANAAPPTTPPNTPSPNSGSV